MTINEDIGVSGKIRTCVKCGAGFKVAKGHKYGMYCSGRCYQAAWYKRNKDKRDASVKAWRERNPGKQAGYLKAWNKRNPGKMRSHVQGWMSKQSPAWHMYVGAKERARANKIPFTITLDDIVVPDVCPYLNIPLFRGPDGKATKNSPSLDRVVPAIGYVPENIRVISLKANMMKQDATQDELIAFAHAVLRLHS